MKKCKKTTYAAEAPMPGVFLVVYVYLLLRNAFIFASCDDWAAATGGSELEGVVTTCEDDAGTPGPCKGVATLSTTVVSIGASSPFEWLTSSTGPPVGTGSGT